MKQPPEFIFFSEAVITWHITLMLMWDYVQRCFRAVRAHRMDGSSQDGFDISQISDHKRENTWIPRPSGRCKHGGTEIDMSVEFC